MKTLTSLFLITLLSGLSTITAQELGHSSATMQRRSVFRPATLPGSAALQNPGMPATRDYTRPVTNSSLSSASPTINPSLTINPVMLNRRPAYSSTGYQPLMNNQQPGITGIRVANGGLLNTLTGLPSALIPGLPITVPTLPSIINPVIPIVAPIIDPILPIVTPIIPIIVNPVIPIIKPILPIQLP